MEHHHHQEQSCSCHHEHHDHGHEEHGCGCGHCHHDHDHEHSENNEGRTLLIGAALFVLGIVLESLGFGIVSLPVYVGAYLLLGAQVLVNAGKGIVRGHVLDENFLMGVATVGAFVIGEFPEAVGIMLFYRAGEFFEEKAVARSRSRIMEAADLRPETVTLDNGTVIPAGNTKTGDVLLVRPGDRIPLDAVVLSGESRIDTAPITGEPVPVRVKAGDEVVSGCVNLSGQLTVRVEKPLSESMVSRILNAVQTAAAGKPKIDRFITRFARVYTPAVVAAAALTAIVPSVITGQWSYWIYTALSFLVMSCPCALVLSVPLAFFSGIGVGCKKGILFKGGLAIEALAGVRAVALDKTGTITKGDFRVQQVSGREDTLAVCAACEQNSTHPIAVSIVAAAKEQGFELPAVEEMEEIPGHGIRAKLDGRIVLCGNEKLMARFAVELPAAEQTGSVVWVAVDGVCIGTVFVADTLKPGVKEAVDRLDAMGIQTVMLTGDTEETALAVAKRAGIGQVHARLLPEDKLSKLQDIRTQTGATMFVGDGINDAPVLAGADVGAAMGSGSDAAIEAADVVYMTADAAAIPEAVQIARDTRRIAWQNVVFSLAVKALVMVLGLLGYASMWMAVFADSGVAMLCVLNSIRMLYKEKNHRPG